MMALRRAACVLLTAAAFFASPAYPTSFSVDQSDLYYIQAESGWGIQLVQRGSVIFATMFVYGPSNTPTWYVATMQFAGNFTWTGDLYAATGPYFGTVPFDPANVIGTKVGTMTWVAQTIETGTLSYVVGGVAVTKNVVRQTLVFDDFSGTYLGALHATASDCTSPADNTLPIDVPFTTVSVTQSGQSVSMEISAFGSILTISGTLSQAGQFGTVLGTYTSNSGEVGNAAVSAMNVQVYALAASFSLSSTNIGCQTVGYLAVMRAQP